MGKSEDSATPIDWIRLAQKRFESASVLAERFRPDIWSVCMLCHQSAEVILKAYIMAQTKSPALKSHDLGGILNGCRQYSADFDSIKDNCSKLNPYLNLGHYPAKIEPIEYHMRQAVKDASHILEFTKSKLKDLGYELPPDMPLPPSPDKSGETT